MIAALMIMLGQPTTHLEQKRGGIPCKEQRDLEPPTQPDAIELEISGDSKTEIDWISGRAKQNGSRCNERCPGTTEGLVVQRRRCAQRGRRLGGTHLPVAQQRSRRLEGGEGQTRGM